MIGGEHIKRIRLCRGLTQKQIADFCGCDRAYISEIESFKKIPSEELYNKIIDALYTLESGSNKLTNAKGKNRKEDVKLKNEQKLQGDITEVVRGTNK